MIHGAVAWMLILLGGFAAGEATCGSGVTCATGLPTASAHSGNIQQVLSIVFAVIAALTILFIVIAGLRFVTAQGNPQEIAKARATIAYAIAGLLVALMAEAIVRLVLGKL